MPAGLIHEHDDVLIGLYRLRVGIEEELHRPRRHLGQNQREGVVRSRFAGGKEVGEGEAIVGKARRALAFRVPAVADAALLPDARLILEDDAQALAFMCSGNRSQQLRGSF